MSENRLCNPENGIEGDVKDRLLDEAERFFAEQGYGRTGVRQLAAAAGCNIAAVNYYFGGKDNLYGEVWKRVLKRLTEVRLESIRRVMEGDSPPPLEELLRSFARAFVGPLTGQGSGRLIKLMEHEMFEAVLPAATFVEEVIRPTVKAMGDAIARTCPEADRSRIPLFIFSIIGQLIHVVRVRVMFERGRAPDFPKPEVAEMIEHVVRFSAAGIRNGCGGEG